jgi:signal transduction histidine kinase
MFGFARFFERYSLRIRIITIISALTLVLVVLIGIVMLKIAEHNLLKQKIRAGNLALAGIQASLNTFWDDQTVLIRDEEVRQFLEQLVFETSRNLHLIDLVLVDPNKRVIISADPKDLGESMEQADVWEAFRTGQMQASYRPSKATFVFGLYDQMDFAGPLFLKGETVAVARFAMPLDDVSTGLAGTLNVLYLYAFFDLLLVLIIGGYLLLYLLVRPLSELRQATDRIILGDLDHPVPVRSLDEIGVLAKDLEVLRCTLKQKEMTVQEQMRSSESLNKQLTRIRDQLIHTDRLAYLGRVTAGVAHEIGNPLGSIYGYLDILKTCSDDPGVCDDVIGRMSKEIERIDTIMKELLNFSRTQKESRVPISMTSLIQDCLEILRTQRVLDQIEVTVEGDLHAPKVLAEESQLKQVFLNLMVNAADAMGNKGKLGVSLIHGKFEPQFAFVPLLGPEPQVDSGEIAYTDTEKRGIVFSSRIPYTEGETIVMVNIKDDGPGIDKINLSSIFEPFFTTKEKSKGTGLGLSICQRIVESIGGVLRVQSHPGQGTVVSCFFLTNRESSSDSGETK